jgi:hypothetical protein
MVRITNCIFYSARQVKRERERERGRERDGGAVVVSASRSQLVS